MHIDGKTFLVLAPHTDDGELGCGGTMSRIIREGGKIICWAFSAAEESLPEGFTKDGIISEMTEAMDVLGVTDYTISDYPVRRFPEHRQEILEEMVKFGKDVEFDTVLIPSRHDTHQDHGVIYCEAFRAFKDHNILSYEMPYNSIGFDEQLFIALDEIDVRRKCEAMKKYKSQARRMTSADDFIAAQAKFRGGQIKAPFAEVFEIVRWKV